jgi:hypothetical protein
MKTTLIIGSAVVTTLVTLALMKKFTPVLRAMVG